MIMSKEEFIDLYNANNIRITGRSAAARIVEQHYKYFLEAAEITKSCAGYPVFEKDKDGKDIDQDGNLSWKFQPVYDKAGPQLQ